MSVLSQLFFLVWASWLLVARSASAFVSPSQTFAYFGTPTHQQQAIEKNQPQQRHNSRQMMILIGGDAGTSSGVVDMVTSSSSSVLTSLQQQLISSNNMNPFLLATVDADIAKLSDNEFAPIFAGGILVMFGGVASALIVGAILESRNSYANVIADSYAQSEDDEEFWKGLSEEEATKTRELLQRLKDSKEGGSSSASTSTSTSNSPKAAPVVAATSVAESEDSVDTSQPGTSSSSDKAEKSNSDMFSDY